MPLTIKLNIKNPMPYLLISAAFFPISAAFFFTLEDICFYSGWPNCQFYLRSFLVKPNALKEMKF